MKKTLSSKTEGESSSISALRRAWHVSWRLVLFCGIFLALYIPFIVPFFLYPETEYSIMESAATRTVFEFLAAFTVLLAAIAMTRYVDRRPLGDLGLRWKKFAPHFLYGSLIGSALLACMLIALFMYGAVTVGSCAGLGLGELFWAGLAMLLNAFGQEVMVRGYTQQVVRRNFGANASVIVSSVVFVLLHWTMLRLDSLLLLTNLFVASAVFGIAFLQSGNLWLPLGLHFGWNVLQGPILGLPVTGINLWATADVLHLVGPPMITGGSHGPEGGLAATVFLLLASWFLLRIWPARSLLETQPDFS